MSADQDQTQIYLITPPAIDLTAFTGVLSGLLDGFDIACVRLALSSTDADDISRAADTLREVCHQRDVAIVVQDHFRIVEQHGLDGVHLTDSNRTIREARKLLGADAVVGCYCGASRHAGMTAGEIGADYVSFGPVGATALGDGTTVAMDLFEWWSEMIEVPIVAEGNISLDDAARLAPVTDFLALGPELWSKDAAPDVLRAYLDRIR